jgi:hypothetical protein
MHVELAPSGCSSHGPTPLRSLLGAQHRRSSPAVQDQPPCSDHSHLAGAVSVQLLRSCCQLLLEFRHGQQALGRQGGRGGVCVWGGGGGAEDWCCVWPRVGVQGPRQAATGQSPALLRWCTQEWWLLPRLGALVLLQAAWVGQLLPSCPRTLGHSSLPLDDRGAEEVVAASLRRSEDALRFSTRAPGYFRASELGRSPAVGRGWEGEWPGGGGGEPGCSKAADHRSRQEEAIPGAGAPHTSCREQVGDLCGQWACMCHTSSAARWAQRPPAHLPARLRASPRPPRPRPTKSARRSV